MDKKYYFDTSIWLDFFENRDEPNMPKGEWVNKLLNKIINDNDKIVYSNNNMFELIQAGYTIFDIKNMLKPLKPIIVFVEATEKQVRKARDLSLKREIPKRDALHALIARDNKSKLITLDHHFKKILDITKPHKPNDLI